MSTEPNTEDVYLTPAKHVERAEGFIAAAEELEGSPARLFREYRQLAELHLRAAEVKDGLDDEPEWRDVGHTTDELPGPALGEGRIYIAPVPETQKPHPLVKKGARPAFWPLSAPVPDPVPIQPPLARPDVMQVSREAVKGMGDAIANALKASRITTPLPCAATTPLSCSGTTGPSGATCTRAKGHEGEHRDQLNGVRWFDKTPGKSASKPEDAPMPCGDKSPFRPGVTCTRAKGHPGDHNGGREAGSWEARCEAVASIHDAGVPARRCLLNEGHGDRHVAAIDGKPVRW